MSLTLKRASLVSMAATLMMLVFSAAGSGAAAQEKILTQAQTESISPAPVSTAEPTDQPVAPVAMAASLADLVAAEPNALDVPEEINCLAGAIYFEARNEPLDGQLAVGRVIVARTKSGRFPASYCGVVYQPSQFSFVRHHAMPTIKTASPTWRKAVAIARIAHDGRWKSPAEGALYFHAARVHAHWPNAVRVAQIENHVFYR